MKRRPDAEPAPLPRGRPRDEEATARIARATLALLAERGYAATSLDDVAAAVGTSKPTIYRRWPSKPALVADAFRIALDEANPAARRSNDARRDARVILERLIAAVTTTPFGGAVRAIVAIAEAEPALAAALAETDRARRAVLLEAVMRIVGDEALAEVEVDALLGAIYFRFLVRRAPLTKGFAAALVERIG
jgi:AcrR family transcriptional regulator